MDSDRVAGRRPGLTILAAGWRGAGGLSDRALAALGLSGVAIILFASLATALPYAGYAGEAYSPLNHFISELGEVGRSQLALVFDGGVIVGAILLGSFLFVLSRRLSGRYRPALAIAGVASAVFGLLVGVFPMDTHALHRLVSEGFFLTGWIVAATFTIWLARAGTGFPRALILPGLVSVAVDFAFVAVYTTYSPADPDAPIVSRSDVWSVPLLEWASLLTLLLWFACVALALLRRGEKA